MKKGLITSLLLTLFISCSFNKKENVVDKTENYNIIKGDSIVKSLELFMNTYSDVKDPWNAPLIYILQFSTDNHLKFSISCQLDLIHFINEDDPIINPKLRGYFEYNERYVVVYNLDGSEIDKYINLSELLKENIHKLRTINETSESFEWTFVPPYWDFKIDSIGNIMLLGKTDSKNKFLKNNE